MPVFKISRISFLAVILLAFLPPALDAANILFFMGLGTYSHRILVWPLVERLLATGHNVTFYQPIKSKTPHPNVTEYFPNSLAVYLENTELKVDDNNFLNQRLIEGRIGIQKSMANEMPVLGFKYCEAFLSVPELDNFLQTTFDLVIVDSLFNECAYGVAYKLNSKIVLFGTSTLSPWTFEAFGFPHENSWIPHMFAAELKGYPLSFSERVLTTLLPFYIKYNREVNYFSKLEKLLRDKLRIPDMPNLADLERRIALYLFNTHFSEEYARSLPPFAVSIGGIHCPDENFMAKALPEEIERFIKAGDGKFIYVSFGSAVRISEAPKYLQNIFFEAFRQSKSRFLWKWDGPRPADMPDNVFTAEWMPQLDILAHRRPKAFITHGGLLGIQEAIRFEIPMIAIPIFAEQDYNAFRIDQSKRGIRLDVTQLTVDNLSAAISEILTNPIYQANMKKTARLFKDRPMKPVDEAVWWIEYVLRNNDTSGMKPLTMNQYWFQNRLLDVWAFVFFTVTFLLSSVIYGTWKLINLAISIIITRNVRKKLKNN